MNRLMMFVLLVAIILLLSCKDLGTNGGGGGKTVNPNILLVKSCCTDIIGGDFRMGAWTDNVVYCVSPGRRIKLSSNFQILEDTLVLFPGGYRFMSNYQGGKVMLVRSNFSDVSSGRLLEIETQTFNQRTLRDSTYNVSSAIYTLDENQCIYYSYGNSGRQIPAGYYKLDLSTLQDSLLFGYVTEVGPAEVTNGFDISSDGMRLLLPINREVEPPLMVEYTLATGARETLNVSFDRQLLWVRYHPTRSQILYSNYPRGAGGSTVATDGEIGVIERASLTKRVLDANPFADQGWRAVSVFPNWSPDGLHIVYGGTKGPAIEPPRVKGAYSLFILKNVN